MSSTLLVVPPEDARVISCLCRILVKRLIEAADEPLQRQALVRGLFALLRLPLLIPDLNLSISAGRGQLRIDSEHCGFVSYTDDGHTEFRIQYFAGSTHCVEGFSHLHGEDRIAAATLRLDAFGAAMERPNELSIEDHSAPGLADEPPIDNYLTYARTYDVP